MSILFTLAAIVAGLILLFALIWAGIYNNLIRRKNMVDNAFASVDVMLKKRYDLIPALVETVKGYMKHEQSLLMSITELRTRAISGNTGIREKLELDQAISSGLGQVMVSVEKYPDLKASQNFLQLQAALNETEEQLAASRRFYNSAVAEYQNAIQQFPSSLVAKRAGMEAKNYFSIPDEQKEPVPVNFN